MHIMEDSYSVESDSENQLLLSDYVPNNSESKNQLNHLLVITQSDQSEINNNPDETLLKIYRRRWYILGLFSIISFVQCTVWNTWGPISESALTAYPSWNEATIALFGNWGTITYVVFTLPFIWICDTYGLRVGMIMSICLMTFGTLIRCTSSDDIIFTWMAHVGANLNGLAGIVLCSVPPALSSLWFPPHERTTATAISTVFNQLGNAGGFLLGPWMVREPQNGTLSRATLQSDILNLMIVEALICGLLLVFVLVYFPPRPPHAPSLASTVPRLNIKQGLTQICWNPNILLLTSSFSFSQGILGAWLGVLNIHLEPLGFSQVESGWLGVWSIISSCVIALIVARLTDILTGHMKLTMTFLLCISSISFTFLALMCLEFVPASPMRLYVSIILGSCANYAASPLFYELTSELAFPVDETVVGGFMSCLYNLVGAIFLFAFFIPHIGVTWMNYCLVAAPAISLPFLFLTREEYRRSELDRGTGKPLVLSINGCEDEI